MAELHDRLLADMKDAMRAHDEMRLSTIRFLRAAIKNAEIAVQVGHQASDSEILAIIRKQIKMRQDAASQFDAAGRADLADKERAEVHILLDYVPTALDEESVRAVVREVIATQKVTGSAAQGAVIRGVMERLRDQTDGRTVQNIVREELARAAT